MNAHNRMPKFALAITVLVLLASCVQLLAEDVSVLREQGIQALNDSRANPRRIIDAARFFSQAEELYAAAGNDEKAVEMNSFLFWCKKKMTLADTSALEKTGETAVTEKLKAVEQIAPKADEARVWFDRAEKFARENPGEHFLIAVRFNEVAARFKGHELSFTALDRSLKEQDLSLSAPPSIPPLAPSTVPATTNAPPPVVAGSKPEDVLRDKTLVAFVRLDKLNQHGGSPISITDSHANFDSILYGQLEANTWMAGGEYYNRTQRQQKDFPKEKTLSPYGCALAVTYRGRDISIYYNGKPFARYTASTEPLPFGTDAQVLLGYPHEGNPNRLSGSILDARIYDRALTDEQVARLRPSVAGDVKPWAWWTFENDKGLDRMGRFAPLNLANGAKILNGALVLDGRQAAASARRKNVP